MDTQVSILDMRRRIDAWKVTFGKTYRLYYTEYHAEQLARALRLNGTECTVTQVVLTS